MVQAFVLWCGRLFLFIDWLFHGYHFRSFRYILIAKEEDKKTEGSGTFQLSEGNFER